MTELLYADLTYQIRKAMFNVYNVLGFGHKEHVYQKALEKEFEVLQLSYESEPKLKVTYRDISVGVYKPDFLIDGKVIIELKSLPFLPKNVEKQVLYYLKATSYELALIVNFGEDKLVIKRVVWTGQSAKSVT